MVNESTPAQLETYLDRSKIRSKVIPSIIMFVLHALSHETDTPETKLRIATIAFCCLQLREAISYFSHVDITIAEIEQCKKACLHLFNVNSLLLKSVSPTLWTIGYAIPTHMKILFDRYGMGLGINSMQGREVKHVRLSEFVKHSTKSTRWSYVMTTFVMCASACMNLAAIYAQHMNTITFLKR